MAAHDSVNKRQFLYHEAHLNDRESIRAQGLRPGRPISMGDKVYPAGVYLSGHGASEYSSSMNDASHFGYDRWRADVTGLNVHSDPMQPASAPSWPKCWSATLRRAGPICGPLRARARFSSSSSRWSGSSARSDCRASRASSPR